MKIIQVSALVAQSAETADATGSAAPQVGNLRYGRLEICATLLAALQCFLLLAINRPPQLLAAPADSTVFARTNLVAWCIVPFDAKKRGPEERAQMLKRLGIQRLAYDWRPEHIPTFEDEIRACKKHGIELTAWWFPTTLNGDARTILALLEKHRVKPQLWVMGDGASPRDREEQAQRVKAEAERIRPIAQEAARIGCTVGLYGHGGWFGQPSNQVAIIKALGMTNLGIVYNFHHGHEHIERFAEVFSVMKPHLIAINLNGMIKDGDKQGKKILALGAGDKELTMLKTIRESGWHGPVGIIDHRPETDSEQTLRENLQGLEGVLKAINPTSSIP